MAASDKIVETICPSCNHHCHAKVSSIGKKIICENCNHSFEAVKFNPASLLHNFYKIALKNDLISEKNFDDIFSEHKALKKPGQTYYLEDLFIEKGLITEEQKNRLMLASVRKLNKKFINLAIEKNFVTKEEGDLALEQQAEDFKNDKLTLVGDILISNGLLNQEQRENILNDIQKKRDKEKTEQIPSQTEGNKWKFPFVGIVALKKGLISRDQLEDGLRIKQKEEKNGVYKSFDDTLYDTGIISSDEKDKIVLKALKKLDKKLGEIAIENGFVTKEELQNAAAMQAAAFKKYDYKPLFSFLLEDEEISALEYEKIFSKFQGLERKEAEDLAEKGRSILSRLSSSRNAEKEDRVDLLEKKAIKSDTCDSVKSNHPDDPEVRLDISEDYQSAWVTISSSVEKDIEASMPDWVKDIKELMEKNDIVFGVIEDDLIKACLKTAVLKHRSFKVAIGEPPKEGKKAQIIYHFDTDYLKAGVVTEDGVIDFRDRGDIPYARKGDLVAELIPAVKGKNGYDILGHVIEVEEMEDISLQSGSGTVLSEDGLRLFADIDGRPDLAISGQISIYPEMVVQGDVNFETGNVEFKGNVNVQGTICEGFKVKGVNLTAKNINGGEIEVTGNVDISGGIVDTKIKADGYVQAMYISGTTVEAYGDLLIVKEIIDSDVRLSGMCKSERCKIISSSISAKMGVEVGQIGTDVSDPCRIRVGLNDHVDALVQSKEDILVDLKEKLGKSQGNVEKYLNLLRDEHQKIIEASMHQDTLDERIKEIMGNIKEERAAGNSSKTSPAISEIEELTKKLGKYDEKIKDFFNHQDRYLDIILSGMASIELFIDQIEKQNDEIRTLLSKSQIAEGKAIVKVKNQLFAKTIIFGKYSSVITQEDLKNVTITETRVTDPEGRIPPRWEMEIKKLK